MPDTDAEMHGRYTPGQEYTRRGSDVRYTADQSKEGEITITPVDGGESETVTLHEWTTEFDVFPAVVEKDGRSSYTVVTEKDENGATMTIVTGTLPVPDNSTVTVVSGDRSYHGGTTIGGAFRCVFPATNEPIAVYVDGVAM